MAGVASNLWLTWWRLLPANPIVVREVGGGSKRRRHFWFRFGYLAILLGVVTVALVSLDSGGSGSLAGLAKRSSLTFRWAAFTQLALVCFLAPVFTAGAITQERNAQTFNILLSTPLSNAQIVLGSLLSRLYFVVALLIGGLPFFFVTMIYGGVTVGQIVESAAIAGATAVLTGSLAIVISVIRVGTRRTIFGFFVAIAVYLIGVGILGRWQQTWVSDAPANLDGQRMSWLAPLHPFLAQEVALSVIAAPSIEQAKAHGAVARHFLAHPARAYVSWTLGGSALLVIAGMFFVRRGALEGERTFFSTVQLLFTTSLARDRRRKPRRVWKNPIAWREAVTRASATSRGIFRYVLLGGGVIAAVVLLVFHARSGAQGAATIRSALLVIIAIECGLVLLLATNTAASAMTKEKESRTMDLVLCTPATSNYIVLGKLRGLVSFTVPLLAVPVGTLILFGLYGVLYARNGVVVFPESGLELALLMLCFSAFCCLVGLHFSLKSAKTVRALMVSGAVLIVGGLVVTVICNAVIDGLGDGGGAVAAPFAPPSAILALVNPASLFDGQATIPAGRSAPVRALLLLGTLLSTVAYTLVVFYWYKSMVRNFDMIVRKQSGQ